jgi:hypothetical protein
VPDEEDEEDSIGNASMNAIPKKIVGTIIEYKDRFPQNALWSPMKFYKGDPFKEIEYFIDSWREEN